MLFIFADVMSLPCLLQLLFIFADAALGTRGSFVTSVWNTQGAYTEHATNPSNATVWRGGAVSSVTKVITSFVLRTLYTH